jgi:hypothetical protein
MPEHFGVITHEHGSNKHHHDQDRRSFFFRRGLSWIQVGEGKHPLEQLGQQSSRHQHHHHGVKCDDDQREYWFINVQLKLQK